jgi:hypothetical protein
MSDACTCKRIKRLGEGKVWLARCRVRWWEGNTEYYRNSPCPLQKNQAYSYTIKIGFCLFGMCFQNDMPTKNAFELARRSGIGWHRTHNHWKRNRTFFKAMFAWSCYPTRDRSSKSYWCRRSRVSDWVKMLLCSLRSLNLVAIHVQWGTRIFTQNMRVQEFYIAHLGFCHFKILIRLHFGFTTLQQKIAEIDVTKWLMGDRLQHPESKVRVEDREKSRHTQISSICEFICDSDALYILRISTSSAGWCDDFSNSDDYITTFWPDQTPAIANRL